MVINEDTVFDSIDIILNNSNYQLSDLKKMYFIDFYSGIYITFVKLINYIKV